MNTETKLPIAIIGAGPVGLAAAAHLTERDLPFVVLEASNGVAASFASVAHVRLFSPWRMNLDHAAVRLLERTGWKAPAADLLPTAGEMRSQYLEPLSKLLAGRIEYDTRVTAITRRGYDKVKTSGRENAPFILRLQSGSGEHEIQAGAVIDASGTWMTPNWMGSGGLPALGEREHAQRIAYGMPDILGTDRDRYANKRVLVLGAGHSAAGNLIALSQLAAQAKGTTVVWAVRSETIARTLGGGANDGLAARGQLGTTLRELVTTGKIVLELGFGVEAVTERDGKLEIIGRANLGSERAVSDIDEVIISTGSRPDWTAARELRLKLDPWLESTDLLAPLIDPNVHSCGSVPPHGHRELAHPEIGFYAVGAKSYGRAPNFLLATGYEQVRSVVAALAGDLAAADDVLLELPETGVCSTDFVDEGGGRCTLPQGAESTSKAACGTSPGAKSASRGCCG
jgi:thioredoxin reductase